MKQNRGLVYLAGLAVVMACASAHAEYADILVTYSAVSTEEDPFDVLGADDGEWCNFDNADEQNPGYVTVGFSDYLIQDISGDEVIVHLWDWGEAFETFEVFASLDDQTYYSIGFSGPPSDPGGEKFEVGFDLGVSVLNEARYIKIVNGTINSTSYEGPDIDAIEGLPEPATLSLLALGGLAVLRRRR